MENDIQAIQKVIEKWMAASKAGDTETVLGLMTEDAIFMVPGAEPFGKEAFATASESQSGMEIDGTAEVKEIEVFGTIAYTRTYINMSMKVPGEDPVHKSGYTLTIFKKEKDGKWRLYRDANLLPG